MILSITKKLGEIEIPEFDGELKMIPFDMETFEGIPNEFKGVIETMLKELDNKKGIAYLTIDGRIVEEGNTQRRGGAHIDGNYLPTGLFWNGGSGGGNGWKVGEGGAVLTSEQHKLSYESETGGMLIASSYPSCRGWEGEFDGSPNIGGDCTHIEGLGEGFMLDANTIYYGNSQFIHESLPIDKTVHRTIVRITLPMNYPVINF